MPKARTTYVCSECGSESRQYFGRCPDCGAWNSLIETIVSPEPEPTKRGIDLANPQHRRRTDRDRETHRNIDRSADPTLTPSRSRRSSASSAANLPPAPHQAPQTAHPTPRQAVRLTEMSEVGLARLSSGYAEFDRVLGGGIVDGSLVLIGGEPGIGKSTLLLQAANQLAAHTRVLYVSAEESGHQVKLRAQRLLEDWTEQTLAEPRSPIVPRASLDASEFSEFSESLDVLDPPDALDPQAIGDRPPLWDLVSDQDPNHDSDHASFPDRDSDRKSDRESGRGIADNFYLLPETDLEVILDELDTLQPQVAIIDSIQRIYFKALASAPGSVAQVRECTSALMQVAKRSGVSVFLVGHVTKDGTIAGPRVLEHLVDTVLLFEGDRFASHRLLRSMKNRFGATHEIGVFEMVAQGLQEVANPSELFLSSRDEQVSGTATIVACEGTRPIVVEVQALVTPTSFGTPRRSTTGIESSRLQQILAVLEKRVGIPLSKLDTYVASVGGIRVEEPAADLGVAIAVVAAFRDRIVDHHTVIIGEVGLGGQVRPVPQLELRLREAQKLGFKRAIVPRGKGYETAHLGVEVVQVSRVLEAILAALPRSDEAIVREPVLDGSED